MKKIGKFLSILSIITLLLLMTNFASLGKINSSVNWSDGSLYSQYIVDTPGDAPAALDILSVHHYNDSTHHFFHIRTNGAAVVDEDTTYGIIISNNNNDSNYEYGLSTTTDSTTLGIYNWVFTDWMALDNVVGHIRLNNDSVGFGIEFAVDIGEIPFDSADYFKAVVSNGPSGGNAFSQPIGVWKNNNDPSSPVSFYCYDYTSDGNIGIVVPEFSNIGTIIIWGTLLVNVGIILLKKKQS